MPLANYLYLPRRYRGSTGGPGDPDPDPGDPGEPGEPTASVFDLRVNPDFDPENPKLKNGYTLTGDALTAWQGLNWLLSDYTSVATTPSGSVTNRASTGDLYQYGRTMGLVYGDLFTILRLFGDVRALDAAVELADIQASQFMTRPSNDHNPGIWLPTHPYRRWNYYYDPPNAGVYYGTDTHMDRARTHTPLANLLYALRVNHGAVSQHDNNYNFRQKADFWEDYFRNDLIPAWQGPESRPGITRSGSSWISASGWADNYEGNQHNIYTGTTGRRRAGVSGRPLWPIFSRHHTHTHVGCSALHYWLGKAVPEWSEASEVGKHGLREYFFRRNMYYFEPPSSQRKYSGTHASWPRSLMWTDHLPNFNSSVGWGENYPQPSSYAGYIFMDVMSMWLEGAIPNMPDMFGTPITRTLNTYMYNQSNHAGTWVAGSIMDDKFPPNTAVNERGDTMVWRTAAGNTGYGSTGAYRAAHNAAGMYIAFDTSDDYLENYLKDVMTRDGNASSGRVGITQPRVIATNIGIILKAAGAKNWVLDEDAPA